MMRNKTFKAFVASAAVLIIVVWAVPAMAQEQRKAMSIDELLRQVESGRVTDNREYRQREEQFSKARAEQQNLLRDAERERNAEEARSQRLEDEFEANDLQIDELTEILNERLGSLKELFGVMQQVAGHARERFDNSLTNIQYPDRGKFLEALAKKIGGSAQLPSLNEIERLWFELQR